MVGRLLDTIQQQQKLTWRNMEQYLQTGCVRRGTHYISRNRSVNVAT